MKAGVTKTYTKDQQYVQISYYARKSGYMTGFNLGPEPVSEEGGAEGGGEGGVASEEDQGMSPPAGYGEESSEDVDNPILETPPVVQEEWVKELTKIPGIDGYLVIQPMPLSPFRRKNLKGSISWGSMIPISLSENLNWFQEEN